MAQPEKFDFVNAKFTDEHGEKQGVITDSVARIAAIDMDIRFHEDKHRSAASSYEEREVERTIRELNEEKTQIMNGLNDEQRESLQEAKEE